MAKQRLKCPGCGKKIAVRKEAKKARCPSCKEVVDVAAVLAGGTEGAGRPAAEDEVAKGKAVEEKAVEDKKDAAAAEGAEAEEKPAPAAESPPAAEPARPAGKPERAAREAPAPEEPSAPEQAPERLRAPLEPALKLPPPIKLWMVTGGGTVVLFGVLCIFFEWYAAIAIASTIGVYVDATLSRIARVVPSSPGYALAPTLWGLIGVVPFFGAGLYAVIRQKLINNSARDIAPPEMSREDMEDEGLIPAPGLASPGMLLVIGAVVVLAILFPRPPSLTLRKCTITGAGHFVPSDKKSFRKGEIGFLLEAQGPLRKAYGKLAYSLVELRKDEEIGEIQTDTTGDIDTSSGRAKAEWIIQVDKAGRYRMDVNSKESGKAIASVYFRIMKTE